MEFLAGYVRAVHANRYYKSLLIKNPGSTYLDIITASDVAYIVSLLNNSDKVWLGMTTSDGDLLKPQYTSGKGIKRVYGVTTWNRSGMKYYRDVLKTWAAAFTRNTPAFKVLRRHWKKWIEDKDGGRKFMLNDGDVKKTAYSLLKTRSEEDVCAAADDDDDEVDDEDHEEFQYDSDPEETIILSNWDRRRGGRGGGGIVMMIVTMTRLEAMTMPMVKTMTTVVTPMVMRRVREVMTLLMAMARTMWRTVVMRRKRQRCR